MQIYREQIMTNTYNLANVRITEVWHRTLQYYSFVTSVEFIEL